MNTRTKTMKTQIKNLFLLPAVLAGLVLMTASRATAQTFTTLYNFEAAPGYLNTYGAIPDGGVILSGNTLYGTAFYGGSSGYGTVYALNTESTNISLLNVFDGVNDEAYSYAGLLLSGDTLYGTTQGPGTTSGAVFAVNTNGTGFNTFCIFSRRPTPLLEPTATELFRMVY